MTNFVEGGHDTLRTLILYTLLELKPDFPSFNVETQGQEYFSMFIVSLLMNQQKFQRVPMIFIVTFLP